MSVTELASAVTPYRAPAWLIGGHAQTIHPFLLRRPDVSYRRERIETPDGTVLPTGSAGEIVVRGPMVMQGYWQQPEATAAVLSLDGWLRTGDIGYLDDEGYLFIVDRVKDMVISGGENIYCAEVERIINAMPGVAECAAFGIPDERLGELLVARVVGDALDDGAVIAEVAEKLARYKAPAEVRVDITPLPRNDVGKVDKRRLREDWIRTMEGTA